jgi:hypothetical protein
MMSVTGGVAAANGLSDSASALAPAGTAARTSSVTSTMTVA